MGGGGSFGPLLIRFGHAIWNGGGARGKTPAVTTDLFMERRKPKGFNVTVWTRRELERCQQANHKEMFTRLAVAHIAMSELAERISPSYILVADQAALASTVAALQSISPLASFYQAAMERLASASGLPHLCPHAGLLATCTRWDLVELWKLQARRGMEAPLVCTHDPNEFAHKNGVPLGDLQRWQSPYELLVAQHRALDLEPPPPPPLWWDEAQLRPPPAPSSQQLQALATWCTMHLAANSSRESATRRSNSAALLGVRPGSKRKQRNTPP